MIISCAFSSLSFLKRFEVGQLIKIKNANEDEDEDEESVAVNLAYKLRVHISNEFHRTQYKTHHLTLLFNPEFALPSSAI